LAGLPWFLLAAGIVLVVVGALLGGLWGPPEQKRRIHRRMRDADIVRELNATPRLRAADCVILCGFACIVVSVGWRILRQA
jgi:hypothetical protein